MTNVRLSDHLEKLAHFVGVVRCGSMRRYSLEAKIAQSAVSKSLQILETTLECSLLLRGREGVQLTQEGKNLFDFAEPLLSKCNEVESLIRSTSKFRVSSRLVMGTYSSIGVYFLPHFFKFIGQQQPDLHLSFVNNSSAELVRLLRAGAVDFIISINPPKRREIHSRVIYSDTYSLYRKSGDSRSLSEVALFSHFSARDRAGRTLDSYLASARLRERAVGCGDFESAKAMVEHGAGYGLLPNRVAAELETAGKIERVPKTTALQNIAPHDIEFSCRKHRASDAALQWVQSQIVLMLQDTGVEKDPTSF